MGLHAQTCAQEDGDVQSMVQMDKTVFVPMAQPYLVMGPATLE